MANIHNSMKNSPHIYPSQRVDSVEEYYFSRKLCEVAALRAAGNDIISLAIGGPDTPPPPEVIDTLTVQAHRHDTHSYQPGTGIPELKKAMADWYRKSYGVELDPAKEILPLIGSKEGVMHVSMAFLNPGDGVLVPNPGYPTYTSASRLVGAAIYPYSLTEEHGWMPDFDELESLPLDHIKVMWVNYPHMPTGAQPTMELFEKLIEFGRKHSIVIAHDNPYSFILTDKPMSILQVPGAKDVALEMNSLSKSHSMAGWRVAMLASNPDFVNWIYKVKSNVDSGQFKPVMMAAVKALEQGREWHDALNELYWRRRVIAEQIMQKLQCRYNPQQRGLFLWGKIPDTCPGSEQMADELLYNKGVFIAPGFIFGTNGTRYIRISLCATEENLTKALQRLS